MTSNRQARINRLKAAFQKAEALMNEGYIVQWDGEVVEKFCWSDGLALIHPDDRLYVSTSIYYGDDSWSDLADYTITEINAELAERLTVWKKVEIEL